MEAKDTVQEAINRIIASAELRNPQVFNASRERYVAELSFKTGWGEGVKVGQLAGLANGIKEVVEWTRSHGYLIDGHTQSDLERLKAKLEEWGL